MTSARHLFCYYSQRVAVSGFLHEVGSSASHSHLCVIRYAKDMAGLDHVTFMAIKDQPLPKWLVSKLRLHGATLIEITPGEHRLTATHFR